MGILNQFKGVPHDFRPTCRRHVLYVATLLKLKLINAVCRSVFAACSCFWTLKTFGSTVTRFTDFLIAGKAILRLLHVLELHFDDAFLIIMIIILCIYYLFIHLCVILTFLSN